MREADFPNMTHSGSEESAGSGSTSNKEKVQTVLAAKAWCLPLFLLQQCSPDQITSQRAQLTGSVASLS